MSKTALFAVAIIASAATLTPTAGQALQPVTATSIVKTADLDLATESGQRQLDLRIAQAAREVCGEGSSVDLEGRNSARACRDETIALANSQREQLLTAARSGSRIVVASAR